jgi:hypothetical protein
MTEVRLHFSPGFSLGGGFPAERILLQRYSILLCGKENVQDIMRQQLINTHVVLCVSIE